LLHRLLPGGHNILTMGPPDRVVLSGMRGTGKIGLGTATQKVFFVRQAV
jgi:hypothetical protein